MVEAARPEAENEVRDQFHSWVDKVQSSDLVKKACQLWAYFNSPECSTTEKIIIVAALLYLISPIDAIPDFLPIVGWLDDIAIATAVLAYLSAKASDITDRR
ncbi:MAG: DUF1232 domain-containing protein [Deltaproteobacteria bacterium]|nr:DUF1232 domain-containing protein [Deltaproteobacteria bacterium]